jgi:ComF family protein
VFLERLVALLVPPLCLACRAPLTRAGDGLCAACRADLPWLGARVCRRCGLPTPCAPCPARRAAFSCAWAPLAHDATARALVGALKFRGATAAADVMAAHMLANAPPRLLSGAALVPVPAHSGRRRVRGYDHAALLARALARRSGLPLNQALERVDRGRQVGAGRARRRARGRIEVRARGAAPRRAVLIDDVHTTGATLDACARALRGAGSRQVAAVTYTRALP